MLNKMELSSKRIPFFAYLMEVFLVICEDDILAFEFTGSTENKNWGNDYMAFSVFKLLIKNNYQFDESLKMQIDSYIDDYDNYISSDIPISSLELEYYDSEDSVYLIGDRLYKDIVGSWGPTYWGYMYGVHLGVGFQDHYYSINPVVIEDKRYEPNIRLSPKMMFQITANILYSGNCGYLRNSLIEDILLTIEKTMQIVPELKLEAQMKLMETPFTKLLEVPGPLNDDNEEGILKKSKTRFVTFYYFYMWGQLDDGLLDPWDILKLNGVYLLSDLIYHKNVREFTNYILENVEFVLNLENRWKYLIFIYLHETLEKIYYSKNYINSGIDKQKIELLYNKLKITLDPVPIPRHTLD